MIGTRLRGIVRSDRNRAMHTARAVGRPSSRADVPTPVVDPHPPFGPCLRPPTPRSPPTLPNRQADAELPRGPRGGRWNRWRGIAPAAYPRTFPGSLGDLSRESTPHGHFSTNETKEERSKRCIADLKGLITARFDAGDQARAAAQNRGRTDQDDSQHDGLHLAVEGWKRDGATGDGYTLVCAHANGMHKESWFPVITRLIEAPLDPRATFGVVTGSSTTPTTSRHPFTIDEVWFLDDYHHAASIDLNAGKIGRLHNWEDGARDIVNFVEHVMPPIDRPLAEPGTTLPWGDTARQGRVIGVGHSFGGNAIVQAAHARPDLFEALFLVEPMCVPINSPRSTIDNLLPTFLLAFQALKRRSQWDSLEQAKEAFAKSPVLGRWHPEINDLWKQHGFVPVLNGPGVQLSTPSWAETAVFAEPSSRAVGWDKLAELEMPVGSIVGGDSVALGSQEEARELVLRPRDSLAEVVDGVGHLLVQEDPAAVADCLQRFLGQLRSRSLPETLAKL